MVGPTLRAEKNYKPAPLETENALAVCKKFQKCMDTTKAKAENTTQKKGFKRPCAAKKKSSKKTGQGKKQGVEDKEGGEEDFNGHESDENHEESQNSGGIQVFFRPPLHDV